MRRREVIRALLRERPIHSQKELQRLLRARGVEATQPTLSRDVRELGLVKGPSGYLAPSELASAGARDSASIPGRRQAKLDRLVYQYVLSVEVAGSLVVLRTAPADAQPVALALDGAGLEGAAGTIAGDDTIFLAARSAAAAAKLARRLREAMGPHDSLHPARFSPRRGTKPSRRRA
jgi:transcriptional regulator of arginine metabolism